MGPYKKLRRTTYSVFMFFMLFCQGVPRVLKNWCPSAYSGGVGEKEGNEGKRELNPRWRQAAVQQTAGVWVVVNHPEMSLFPQLNEA